MSESEYDYIRYKANWKLHKFKDPDNMIANALHFGKKSIDDVREAYPERYEETISWPGNVALNQGLQNIIKLAITGSTATKWSYTNAKLGVGVTSTAASAAQTGLLGSHVYAGMDATYPTRTNQTAYWRSTFSSSAANFAWYEYTVSTTATNTGVNLNRKISTKGTKASGETWTLELQVTFS